MARFNDSGRTKIGNTPTCPFCDEQHGTDEECNSEHSSMDYVVTMKDSSVGMVIPASKFHAFLEARRETVSANFRGRLSQLNEFLAHNQLPQTAIDWEMIEA